METIELVLPSELEKVLKIYKAAIQKMEEMQIFQWDEKYPDVLTIENDIKNKKLYGFFINDLLCGIQALDNIQPEEYKKINWHFSDNNPLVIHRLCVDPNYQNIGIARKLLLFSEVYSKKYNFKTIRLDAYAKNPISNTIYKKLDYIKRGIITFRKGDFICYEKEISDSF